MLFKRKRGSPKKLHLKSFSTPRQRGSSPAIQATERVDLGHPFGLLSARSSAPRTHTCWARSLRSRSGRNSDDVRFVERTELIQVPSLPPQLALSFLSRPLIDRERILIHSFIMVVFIIILFHITLFCFLLFRLFPPMACRPIAERGSCQGEAQGDHQGWP